MRDTTDPSSFPKMNGVALISEAIRTRWKYSSTNTTALSSRELRVFSLVGSLSLD